MTAPTALPPGTLVGERYRVDGLLGAGTMGAVYRAIRVRDGREVAIKTIVGEARSPELVKRLEREARALAALEHPHVLAILDLGEDEHGHYLVTELATGESLDAILRRRRLEPELAMTIGEQIVSALAHAHELGILHRDVKPENVIVGAGPAGAPVAKLLDFGLVKFQDRDAWGADSTLTAQGTIVGTPAYLAPEQVFGPGVDARSDVYSAGVLLFELLTGSWPFVAEEVVDVLRAHVLAPVPTLAETRADVAFRPELEALIACALAKKPEARFADARALHAALAAIPRPAAWPVPAT